MTSGSRGIRSSRCRCRRGHNLSRRRPDRSGNHTNVAFSAQAPPPRRLAPDRLHPRRPRPHDRRDVARHHRRRARRAPADELGGRRLHPREHGAAARARQGRRPRRPAPRVPDVARRVPRGLPRLRLRAGHDAARHRPRRAGHELGGPPPDVADDRRPRDDAEGSAEVHEHHRGGVPDRDPRRTGARRCHHRLLGLVLGVLDQHPLRPRGVRPRRVRDPAHRARRQAALRRRRLGRLHRCVRRARARR